MGGLGEIGVHKDFTGDLQTVLDVSNNLNQILHLSFLSLQLVSVALTLVCVNFGTVLTWCGSLWNSETAKFQTCSTAFQLHDLKQITSM